MTLLVTTALETTWGKDEPLLFLGEWCRLYDRKQAWTARQHSVVNYHWCDRAKLARDYAYLDGFHETLLGALAEWLGARHGIDRPLRYWRMLLDPWLVTYVAVVFDRWESARLACSSGELQTLSAREELSLPAPAGYNEFAAQISSDEWNHLLWLEILESEHRERCEIRPSTDRRARASQRPLPGVAAALATRAWLDRLLGLWPLQPRVVFYQSYFSFRARLRLNASLGQMPRLFVREFETSVAQTPDAAPARETLPAVRVQPRNAFESFALGRIVRDVPMALIERFPALRERAAQLNLKPDIIVTANAHWGNELFKTWAAERVAAGAKFVAVEHGGSIPPLFDTMWFEERISDAKATWARAFREPQVRLPPTKIVGQSKPARRGEGDTCLAVGFESWSYSHRATAYPMGPQVLEVFEMMCEFAESLKEVRSRLRIKPFSHQGWNTRQRYIDRLGEGSVSKQPNYYRALRDARIVVCTYPNTTFSEAMSAGVPTILMYRRELFETVPEFDGLLSTLADARILFEDAQAAARHVEEVWIDSPHWWHSAKVAAARATFHELALDVQKGWFAKWRGFLTSMGA